MTDTRTYDTAPPDCPRTFTHILTHINSAFDALHGEGGIDTKSPNWKPDTDQAGHDVNMAAALLHEIMVDIEQAEGPAVYPENAWVLVTGVEDEIDRIAEIYSRDHNTTAGDCDAAFLNGIAHACAVFQHALVRTVSPAFIGLPKRFSGDGGKGDAS